MLHNLEIYEDSIQHKRIYLCSCGTFKKFINHIDLKFLKKETEIQRILDNINTQYEEHIKEYTNASKKVTE
jgi:hypothetical protein